MSRANYTDDVDDTWATICWRGAVASAIRGKRGQAFLRDLLAALDALPEKKLIKHDLETEEGVCAIGAVGKARGVDMSVLDPEDYSSVAATFGVAEALVREIEYTNDDCDGWRAGVTPEGRYELVRRWIERQLIEWVI